ncbi:hypothetical protein K7X08_025753 [Anisodus acutangulus]|uniref:GDSL esterase/lipase n=1 Tax=Anisodus acutangulus TaxID=402998 RepID=A0A9Q1LAJ1_9SOLA|nr:hypothetical protein K7X08_025753 [Anisodus acutangulus]
MLTHSTNNGILTLARANYNPYGVDFPQGATGRFTNGRTYVDILGFEVVDKRCCGVGRNIGQITCIPLQQPCEDRSKYIFWDAFHPTEVANGKEIILLQVKGICLSNKYTAIGSCFAIVLLWSA